MNARLSSVLAALLLIACCGCATRSDATHDVTTVKAGKKITLRAESDGSPPLTYRWEKDGQPIPGADGPVLEIANPQVSDSGVYAVIVSNSAGAVSEPFRLRVVKR